MDIQMEKKTLQTIPQESILLANQARIEQQRDGYVTVICPKCQTHPEIITTSKAERTIVRCACGYIKSIEINF